MVMGKLFTENQDFLQFIPGESNVSIDTIESRIDDVVERIIIPIVSEAQMDALLTAMDGEAALSDADKKLCDKIRRAVANISMAMSVDDLNVTSNVGGFTTKTTENGAIASGERVRRYAEARSVDGNVAIDSLIRFLEKNVDDFTLYRDSDERKNLYLNFVNTSDDANKYLVPQIGRMAFTQIIPIINDIEERLIRRTLCDDLYDFLKAVIKDRTVDGDGALDFGVYAPLVPHIQRAVINLAVAETMQQRSLKIDSTHGVYLTFYKNANEPAQSATAKDAQMLVPEAQYKNRGERAMEDLKRELLKNIDTYVFYKESDCYVTPEENYTKNDDEDVKGVAFFGM